MTEDKKVSAHRRHDHESEGTGIRLCTGRKRNDYSSGKGAFHFPACIKLYINNLEKSLGVRLFERVGKQFILTYAGEQYVEKAKLILQLSHELDEKLRILQEITADASASGSSCAGRPDFCPLLLPLTKRNFQEWK